MAYTHIMLTDQGLLALNAPEKPEYLKAADVGFNIAIDRNQHLIDRYNKALEQAKKEGCYFKHHPKVSNEIADAIGIDWINGGQFELNKPYLVPDGYDVKKKCQHEGIHNSTCIYHAILVQKENGVTKEMQDKMNEDLMKLSKQSLFKQQSIEEAAEKYALKIGDHEMHEGIVGEPFESTMTHFIAGAKSQAAKIEKEAIEFYKFCKQKLNDSNFFDKVNDGNGTADPKKMYEQFKQEQNGLC